MSTQLTRSKRASSCPCELIPRSRGLAAETGYTLLIPLAHLPLSRYLSIMKTVTIGLIQAAASEQVQSNLEKAVQKVEKAARLGAQIICLQELFCSLYFPQTENAKNFKSAESIPGPTTDIFRKLAKRLNVVIILPLFEKRSAGIYHNSAAVIDADGSLAGLYRKMHIPDDPGYFEKFYFTPGDLGFPAFRTRYARISVLICWDQWFPEAARLSALSGAQILFYPTAIGSKRGEPKQAVQRERSAWELVQRAHAVANGFYAACVNRVGVEGKVKFWGNSFVAGPGGEILAQAGNSREEILTAKCDLSKIEKQRVQWPFLRDRRIDAYKGLACHGRAALV